VGNWSILAPIPQTIRVLFTCNHRFNHGSNWFSRHIAGDRRQLDVALSRLFCKRLLKLYTSHLDGEPFRPRSHPGRRQINGISGVKEWKIISNHPEHSFHGN
jgi:hypothetical protein